MVAIENDSPIISMHEICLTDGCNRLHFLTLVEGGCKWKLQHIGVFLVIAVCL